MEVGPTGNNNKNMNDGCRIRSTVGHNPNNQEITVPCSKVTENKIIYLWFKKWYFWYLWYYLGQL